MFHVTNPTSIAVNSHGVVFVVSNFADLLVLNSSDSYSLITYYNLTRKASLHGDQSYIVVVDLWINSFDDVFIGRQNASTIILHSNSRPIAPPSFSSSSSSSTGDLVSSSSTGESGEPSTSKTTEIAIGIGCGIAGMVVGAIIGIFCWRRYKKSSSVIDENTNLLNLSKLRV